MIVRFMSLLVLVAAVVWVYRLLGGGRSAEPRRGYSFLLEYREGRQVRVDGVVPRGVYNAFEDVASLSGFTGRISARPDGALEFSETIPEGVQQQLRNAWWAGKPGT